MDTTSKICENLEHFFSLVCSINGPPRVPFFGLFALGVQPEILFSLQTTRGNFAKVYSSLIDLLNYHRENFPAFVNAKDSVSCIGLGIHEATAMFKKQAQNLLQAAGYWAQLEITIFTSLEVQAATRLAERAVKDLSMDNLKRVQVVSVTNPERYTVTEQSDSQTSSLSSNHSLNSDLSGLVDFTTIENDSLTLSNFFKCWLQDSGTDKEHLHLILPPLPGGLAVTLKCDLQDRILCPSQLPFPSSFGLSVECHSTKSGSLSSTSAKSATLPVFKLRAVKRIPQKSICESVLYGMPQILKATTCWKVDWDELETAQQQFTAMCKLLHDKKEALLAVLVDDNPRPKNPRLKYQIQVPKPKGHFLLLPSAADQMLIKSIAVSELVLPSAVSNNVTDSGEAVRVIQQSLDKVEFMDGYNPLCEDSGLYECLSKHLTKNLPASHVAKTGLSKGASTKRTRPPPNPYRTEYTNASNLLQKRQKASTSEDGDAFLQYGGNFPTNL